MLYSKYFFSVLLMSSAFWISGCGQPEVDGDHYTLDECKKELLEAEDFDESQKIDYIVVVKKERKMYLYRNGKVMSTFPVSLGKNPVGQKIKKGDNRTPEGTFWIHRKLCSPKYYRSLCISYPRPQDVEAAKRRGVNPGGSITIHAQPTWNADGHADSYTLANNWTQGCVAVTNSAMKQLWYAVREGVPVTIK
ncbi:MAG: L,D-transpeptidase [Sulfurovum sp.]|nr:L,D-transpeptidase [Sulfurovum sp.]